MSAFDRLQNYSAKRGLNETSSVFDTNTPQGAFLNRVHQEGYAMYHILYSLKEEYRVDEVDLLGFNKEQTDAYEASLILDESAYKSLSNDLKERYIREVKFTELHNALTTCGDQVINAIAGSGKTSALTFKVIHDIVTGEATTLRGIPNGNSVRVVNKMWVCTFLKTGAEELEKSVSNWQRRLGYTQTSNQIVFSTLDAEFKRCVNAMGASTPIADSAELMSLFRKAADSCNISRNGATLTNEDYNILYSIVTYYRGRLDNSRYKHPSCADYSLTPSILDLLVNQFASLRQAKGVMDFEEIMELLYKYLYIEPNPAVQDFVANRYNFIYVDEFQDTSQMAYAILKFYARGRLWINKRKTEVPEFTPTTENWGTSLDYTDDGSLEIKQVILESKPDVCDGLYIGVETLGKLVVVGDVSQCIYSFRGSDSKILGELFDKDFRPCISTLSTNWRCPSNILNPIVPSIHENKSSKNQVIKASKEGGEFFAYEFSSYKNMIKQLKEDIQKDMEDGYNVGILCRTNFDGMIPAFALIADNSFNFSISGENMTMKSGLPRKIIGVSSLLTEKSTVNVRNTLDMFCGRAKWDVKNLMDVLKADNTKSIWNIPLADIKYSAPSIFEFLRDIREVAEVQSNGRPKKEKEIEVLRFAYFKLMTDVFSGDTAYQEAARAYIETLLYLIDSNNFKSVYEFVEEVEFLNDKLCGRIKKPNTPIQIATVHEFKGKERDSIYVWNDSENVFPSSKCNVDDIEQLEEERRVHYIACTRAKKREHIYVIKGKIGMFVKEMDLIIKSPKSPSVTL